MARHREQVNVERQRDKIVSAATAVIARNGLQATRLRQVAIEAGLSTGSILYYFSGFDEVLVAAVRAAGAEYCTGRQERIDGEPDPCSALDALVALGVPDSLSDAVRVVYQASSLIGLHPEVVAVLAEMNERQLDLYAQIIDRGAASGVFAPASEARVIARTALALEDAFTLYLLSGYGVDAASARAHIHRYLDDALGLSSRTARDQSLARRGGR
jgi:DNA-binding transcriptional regulator YbjK